MEMIKITLSGEEKNIPSGTSLLALTETLGLKKERIAAELNGEIIPKASYESTILSDGDSLEIVNFVGGG